MQRVTERPTAKAADEHVVPATLLVEPHSSAPGRVRRPGGRLARCGLGLPLVGRLSAAATGAGGLKLPSRTFIKSITLLASGGSSAAAISSPSALALQSLRLPGSGLRRAHVGGEGCPRPSAPACRPAGCHRGCRWRRYAGIARRVSRQRGGEFAHSGSPATHSSPATTAAAVSWRGAPGRRPALWLTRSTRHRLPTPHRRTGTGRIDTRHGTFPDFLPRARPGRGWMSS